MLRTCAQESIDARDHFAGCAAREREQQDAAGVGAFRNQMSDTMGQGRRLAGTRSGEYQQWALAMTGGQPLFVVQLTKESRAVAFGVRWCVGA